MSTASVLIMIWLILLLSSAYHIREMEANGCDLDAQKCGNMHIPFPFTIKGRQDTCGLPGFEIKCKRNVSFGTDILPFLPTDSGEVQILNFSNDHILVNSTQFIASTSCEAADRSTKEFRIASGAPFRISDMNTFVVVGCDSWGAFGMAENISDSENSDGFYYGGCASWCLDDYEAKLSNCSGNGCCQTKVPPNYKQLYVRSLSDIFSAENCTYAAIIDMDRWVHFSKSGMHSFKQEDKYMRLDWAILNETCSLLKDGRNTSHHCDPNADCVSGKWGIECKCRDGYTGYGYHKGTKCKDYDECSDPERNNCTLWKDGGICKNTYGSYNCSCNRDHPYGDGFKNGTGCDRRRTDGTRFSTLQVAIGVSVLLVAVLVGVAALFWIQRRRKSRLVKKNNFHRNGGERLQSLMSSRGEATRIFSLDEIEKATSKFSESLVLGTGGYGTVYKGTLSEELVVAIKKSKSLEAGSKEIEQFINEVDILSQINHRNVVKLLGFCLESPVPLLVYEYISNGTLFEHLYEDKYEHSLEWEDRLRIATETAEALSYLHSAASIPIIHRDVKSSNILLDQGCTAKVADFGVSRLVPIDQTHVSTAVQGTMGYLDPEYFQTVHLTEKSDVYSFGVVLAELLTGLKPISYERTKSDSNLAIYFLSKMKTQGLGDILDSRLNLEDSRNVESMERVAKLATECLSTEGEKRPTMKQVAHELLGIRRGSRVHAWSDGNAAENEDDTVGLIVEEERSDGTTTGEVSMLQSRTYSFGIEGFKDGLRRGR